ncbi:50S ribosomal protein L28 [Modestobacter marinus]|uniref:Large ribosomal subunit protein bL28 n=1 Tax=Modestobacter marinus TaxID=477641 RepID=A0A846LM80_9ACTN|nr:50S ribosomal protein L28 [Modestobacter marinus]NIH68716.1 large subunit ribosomal protein L28 [Modestobacter marinus]GGL59505.1 50S ribosomal protein L28 [Modestobacter marinus]
MATYCEVTGRTPSFGKSVSHSHRRTNRRFDPNLQSKRFFLASENRWIRLTVSTKGIKTIDVQGIEAVVARIRATDPAARRRLGAGRGNG